MAIGTAAAIGIGLAGVGSALGARSQSKAAGKAADTSMAVAQQNNALARDIYGQNQQALSPYVQRGNAAGNTMNALLGLGGSPAQPAQAQSLPTQQPNQRANALALGNEPSFHRPGWYTTPRGVPRQQAPQMAQATAQPQQPGQSPQQAAENAFDIFRDSTGYQFRLGEGMDAVNSGWAGAGTLQSGAAMKAINEYGQNFASNEFGNYMNYLGNQQGVGLGGASALAGVGQNYVNTIGQNNNSAGTAAANAHLVAGANNPFANALGMAGGFLAGRA